MCIVYTHDNAVYVCVMAATLPATIAFVPQNAPFHAKSLDRNTLFGVTSGATSGGGFSLARKVNPLKMRISALSQVCVCIRAKYIPTCI